MKKEVLEQLLDNLLYTHNDDADKALDALSAAGWTVTDTDGNEHHLENGAQCAYLLHNPSKMKTLAKAAPVQLKARPR